MIAIMTNQEGVDSNKGDPRMKKSLLYPLLLVLLMLLGLVGYLSCFVVEESQAAILLEMGRPVRVVTEAGLHPKLPAPFQTVVRVDVRLLLLAPPPAEYLTEDKKNLLVDALMAYRVVDPLRYLEAVADREGIELRLREVLRSRLGAALGRYELGQLVNLDPKEVQLGTIRRQLTEQCDALARESFGVAVESVMIKRIMFPPQNLGAVYRRMAAERERIAKRYLAEGEEQAMKIRSGAKLEAEKLIADARKEAQILVGRTDAEVTELYGRTFSQDVEFYEFLKRLETYEQFLKENSTVVLPADSPIMRLFSTGELQ